MDWMSSVDKYIVKDCAQSGIESMMIISFIISIIFLIAMQKIFQVLCTRMAKNQKILEEKFMGPEIISQAPVARG
jgi:hypothetical protein